MKLTSVLPIAALSLATLAHAASVQTVLGPLRQRMETSDYRAAGQLVLVDASGNRTRYAIRVKGLWFAGALHVLVDMSPSKAVADRGPQTGQIRLLLELHSDGRSAIWLFQPHASAPTRLPLDKWSDRLGGSAISYEDLIEQQYLWPGQTLLPDANLGARSCNVLQSKPGPSDLTHYSAVTTWLDRTIDYPVYVEKAAKQGGMVKEFTYSGLRQSSGVWAATQVEVKIHGRAGATLLTIRRGSAKANLSAQDFRFATIAHFEDRP